MPRRRIYDMEQEEKNNDRSTATREESYRVTLKEKSVSYGTNLNEIPICNLTSEAFPRMTNYKDNTYVKRPSLGELHGDYNIEKVYAFW